MFINICWKSNGEIRRSLMPMDKASSIVQKMENQGIKTWFESEQMALSN